MSQKKRVILVEDDVEVASLLKLHSELSGFRLHVETDGIAALRVIEREMPDLVILDVTLPGENGLDLCRKMRNHQEMKNIPVIMLSESAQDVDVVLAFELGADDYVVKPFSTKVLIARMKAHLRRKRDGEKMLKVAKFSDFLLDTERFILRKGDKQISLTLSEFGILRRLISNKGRVLTRNQLLEDVNNDDALIVDRNIDVHIAALRKKLGPTFDGIETVRGIGYRFKEDACT